jgi:hypothetical protein
MKLSEQRILALVRDSLKKLQAEGLAEVPNFSLALRQGRALIDQWLAQGDRVDLVVRRKITSLKRHVAEGSAEWNILYRRFREEELRKKGPLPGARNG